MRGVVNYYEDGMVCIILTDKKKSKQLDIETIKEYISFPQSTQLHIYGVTQKSYEWVHALVRCARSLSPLEVFCYVSDPTICTKQLAPMCTKVINGVF